MTQLDVRRRPFSVTVTATTHVAATPEAVWEVLADTSAYPGWNPLVRRLEGALVVGGRLTVTIEPRPGEPTTLRPTVVEVVPGESFTWLGRIGVPGVLDGRHTFRVEPDGDGARLVHHEVLSGALVPFFRRLLAVDTPKAFVAHNEALAARATRAGRGAA